MRRRRGFALVWVCFVLVLLGAICATTFFIALQAARAGRFGSDGLRAGLRVEAAAAGVFSRWQTLGLNRMAAGDSASWVDGAQQTVVYRWGATAAAIVVRDGFRGSGAGRVWLAEPALPELPSAVLAVQVQPGLDTVFSTARPSVPSGWDCDHLDNLLQVPIQYYDSIALLSVAIGGWQRWFDWAQGATGAPESVVVKLARGDTVLSSRFTGVLVGLGRVVLEAGAEVRGLLLSQSEIALGGGVRVSGVLVAPRVTRVGGSGAPVFVPSLCAARLVLGLTVPFRPVPGLGRFIVEEDP